MPPSAGLELPLVISSYRFSVSLMAMDPGGYPEAESDGMAWELAEVIGSGLALIFAVLIVTGVALAGVFIGTVGSGHFIGFLGFNAGALGEAFEQGTFWALPQVAVVFVLGSLGLAWWQMESWTADNGPTEEGAAVHIRRARRLVKTIMTMSALCVVGGLLSVTGRCLESTPGANWSTFVEAIGLTIGSVLLGLIGVFAGGRLLEMAGTFPASD